LIDNSEVQLKDFPIEERDAFGNTYQHRPLRDGSIHRVLKNFPTEIELLKLGEELGWMQCRYIGLENFWVFEYELPKTL
jgi:demethylmenaquinone methyltransferase/2-methoxy-6-polyprenyl-1,4-benzoquinol methylase